MELTLSVGSKQGLSGYFLPAQDLPQENCEILD